MSRSDIAAALFTLACMIAALFASLRGKNAEFLMYFAVMCVLFVSVVALHRRVRLHPAAIWGLAVWGAAHMAGGLLAIPESWPIHGGTHVLYNWWIIPGYLKFDQWVHACGFGLVTWICWQCLRVAFAERGVAVDPTFGLLALCAAAGMGFGAANEVVEFIATRVVPETNVGGYDNTGWDLVANMVGAIVAAFAIRAFER